MYASLLRPLASVLLALCLTTASVTAQDKTASSSQTDNTRGEVSHFTSLDIPNGQATWISPDGSTVIGGGDGGWIWTAETGAVILPSSLNAVALAGNDFPLAGSAANPAEGNREEAAIWTAIDAEPMLLGGLPGGEQCDAFFTSSYGMSGDGSVVVGLAWENCSVAHGFQWTEEGGMIALPKLTTDRAARANGVSADGSIIWGWNDELTGYRRAVRWVNGEIEELHDTEGNAIGEAAGANSDASVIVGAGLGIDGQWGHAYRWTAETGAVSIGDLAVLPMDSNNAFDTTEDGTIIVGASGFAFSRSATIWTEESGELVWLTDYLEERDIEVPDGWDLNSATAISDDGRFIAGWGFDANGINSFIIDLNPDETPEGPENDNIADAFEIPIANATYQGNNVGATLEEGEFDPSCTFGPWTTNYSVWWTFTTDSETNRITVDTFGSDIDTILSLHRADDLSEVACDDDTNGLQSQIEDASIVPGETYLIRVAGYEESGSNQGDIQLTAAFHWVSGEDGASNIVQGLTHPSPNPVRDRATLALTVEQGQQVTVEAFDIMGRRVQVLYEGSLVDGSTETLTFNTAQLSSGIYVIRAVGENFVESHRVTVVR